jgi:phosphopentomutase
VKLVLIVLDGVGVGELPDAGEFGDRGSNTLGNTARAVGGLHLPQMAALGLGNILEISGVGPTTRPKASFGKMAQLSRGKDSTTGHWELAGVIVERAFPTFSRGFPPELLDRFLAATGCGGYLGNVPASGTAIIQQLGAAHVATGFPIVYTSADSVFQIAAHEEVIPLPRLYEICRRTRDEVCTGRFAVGRVIARPFVGKEGEFRRTTNRRDFSLQPGRPTVLDLMHDARMELRGVGKVDDLFGGRGLESSLHTGGNAESLALIVRESAAMETGLLLANLGDFDTLYGHRNDPKGFAGALEEFDAGLPAVLETLHPEDLLIITADHGNDPVAPSTDHSREYVPLLCVCKRRERGSDLGVRRTFADVGKTVAEFFGLENDLAGTSFLGAVC